MAGSGSAAKPGQRQRNRKLGEIGLGRRRSGRGYRGYIWAAKTTTTVKIYGVLC